MSNAADLGNLSSTGGNFVYSNLNNSWSSLDVGAAQGSVFVSYQGLANTEDSTVVEVINATQGQSYKGYATAFDGSETTYAGTNPRVIDNQPTIPWTKDQQIYYKLRGFNANTSTYETWVIVEDIVPRTETFNPSGSFPNIDYNVFFSPPSGNTLSNIRIVARWIQ